MSPWESDWSAQATTAELYCSVCGKTVFIDESGVESGCPVCSSPLVRPLERSFIDLTQQDPIIVLR